MIDINFNSEGPLYQQLVEHFRRQVALGRLNAGERMPAIRELARKLKLDPGTIARAYKELEREGIIVSRHGGGSFISGSATGENLSAQERRRLEVLLEKAILEALGLGFSTEEIETAFTVRFAQWRERRNQTQQKTEQPSQDQGLRFSGSHDLAVELLSNHLNSLYPDINFKTSFVGSLAGLMALEYRDADIAGSHLFDADTAEFNVPFIKRLFPNEAVVLITFMERVQGLMLTAGNPKGIAGITDLKRRGITFVNRQKGSGTRNLLDAQLLSHGIKPGDVRGYEREENTHIAVATLVAQGQADVGLGAQSAASVVGLDFIPLFKERYDLVVLQEILEQPRLQKVLETIRNEKFQGMLRSLPGYDLSKTGNMIVVKPK